MAGYRSRVICAMPQLFRAIDRVPRGRPAAVCSITSDRSGSVQRIFGGPHRPAGRAHSHKAGNGIAEGIGQPSSRIS